MCEHLSSYTCKHVLATRASTCFLHVRARYLFVRARLLFKNVRPGRMFSHCVRARAYTHVLARVYSTRASTCTTYTCFTLPPTRVIPTGLQLSIFQQFWSFVTNIRTSMLPNKFYGRAQPNWDNFVFDFDNCEKSWPCLICLRFIYLQTDHVMPPSPDFERE